MPAHDADHPPFSPSADLAARVGDILRAAEREARAVEEEIAVHRRAAQASARRYELEARRQTDALAQQRLARLRSLTDDLAARAQEIRDRLDSLLTAIGEASDAVARDSGATTGAGVAFVGLASSEPVASPLRTPRPPLSRVPDVDADAARLVAVELAVAGRSRMEAERHLRETFGVEDPRGLLDDVYGAAPEADGERAASGLS